MYSSFTNKLFKHLVIIVLMLLVTVTPAQSETSEGIFVGVIVPLSGSLAALGQSVMNSAELARQAFNADQPASRQLQFIVEDSAGDPLQAVVAFDKLVADDRIVAILGPSTSSTAAPAFARAQINGMVTISPTAESAGISTLSEYAFVTTLGLDVLIPAGLALAYDRLGFEKVVVILQEEELFAQSGLVILNAVFAELGVEVVAVERITNSQTDFSEMLERINLSRSDALFISTLPTETDAILIQAHQMNLPSDILRIAPAFTNGGIATVGEAAEGTIAFSTWDGAADTPGNQTFVQNYRDTYGGEPNRFAAQWHAAVTLLGTAIAQTDSLEADVLRDAVASLQDVDTVLGEFSFDGNGAAVFEPVVRIVRDGMLVPF